MTSRRLLIALGLVILVLIGINYLIRPPVVYDIRVVTPPIIASLPHWIAVEKGFYKDAGLSVLTLDLTNSTLMVQALVSGDADVLPAVSLVDVINGSKTSSNRPLIFSHSRLRMEPPFEALIVMRGSTIANLKELEGKKVAVYPGPTAQAALRLFLERNNVNHDKIQLFPLPPPEHMNALQRGDIDASHIYEPFLTSNLEGGKTRQISGSIYAFLQEPSAIGVSTLSSRFFTQNNEAVRRYLQAWDRSIQFIKEHPDDAREVLRARLKITKEVALKATWVDATKSDEVDQGAVRSAAALFQQMKVMEPVEVDDSFFLPKR